MNRKRKKSLIKLAFEFIKLQLAGNVLFWVTYVGFFVLHELLHWPDAAALATASGIAHIVFFLINKEWVFSDKTGRRKTSSEVAKFLLFMGLNYFINLGIVTGLQHYFDVTPYIGQFVAAIFFSVWNFVGLRFWVFQEMHHHAITVKSSKRRKHVRRRA